MNNNILKTELEKLLSLKEDATGEEVLAAVSSKLEALSDASQQIEELKAKAITDSEDFGNQIGEVKEKLVAQQEANQQLHAALEEAKAVIEERASLPQTENITVEAEVMKMGKAEKVTVEFVVPSFKFEGVDYTANEAANNPELITRLLNIKSGVIKVL